MKRSILQTCILGMGVLQGFLGFTAVSYADTTLIVSKSGPYYTINDAVAAAKGTLTSDPQHVVIRVKDCGPYLESVYITNIPTSSSATLTLESTATGGTTICAPRVPIPGGFKPARPIHIGGTAFVTISGFIFTNDLTGCTEADAMTGINFEYYAPSESDVTFDNCVWDGQGQTYDFKAILFCWRPHCNITVQNSTFQNIVVGTDLSVIYLGARSTSMATAPTFKFSGNRVIDNSDPEVQIEGDPVNGYYHKIVIQDNEFSGNEGDYNLVVIRNQRAGCDIGGNWFYDNTSNRNTVARPTLALEHCGSANIYDNYFLQNDAAAEVFVQNVSGTTKLTANTIAASPGAHFGVWADLSGKTVLKSSGNTFYSNYSTKDAWNTPRTDYVAAWGTGQVALTLDKWNAKTPKPDGNDSFGALPAPTTPSTP